MVNPVMKKLAEEVVEYINDLNKKLEEELSPKKETSDEKDETSEEFEEGSDDSEEETSTEEAPEEKESEEEIRARKIAQISLNRQLGNQVYTLIKGICARNEKVYEAIGFEWKTFSRLMKTVIQKAFDYSKSCGFTLPEKGYGCMISSEEVEKWIEEYYLLDDKEAIEKERIEAEEKAKAAAEKEAKRKEANAKKQAKEEAENARLIACIEENGGQFPPKVMKIVAPYFDKAVERMTSNDEIYHYLIKAARDSIKSKKITLAQICGKKTKSENPVPEGATTSKAEEPEETEQMSLFDDDGFLK